MLPMSLEDDVIAPQWSAPPRVGALVTTCASGNFALHTGDDPSRVQVLRERLRARCGVERIVWLNQVHGTSVVRADEVDVTAPPPAADAIWTQQSNVACAVLTADCVPVFLSDRDGTIVALAHGGWRGLVHGVIEALVRDLPVEPARLVGWLGPAIGPSRYEIGEEVARDIETHAGKAVAQRVLSPRPRKDDALKWLADLPLLAELELNALGVRDVRRSNLCTYDDPRFYSYRRDRTSGRMVSLVWLARGISRRRSSRS
jgi:YfiH family protein